MLMRWESLSSVRGRSSIAPAEENAGKPLFYHQICGKREDLLCVGNSLRFFGEEILKRIPLVVQELLRFFFVCFWGAILCVNRLE